MPVISAEEFQRMLPKLDSKLGGTLIKRFMHISGVELANTLYDRNCHHTGPDFADGILHDLGIDYQVGCAERLLQLPDGPFITVSNHPYGHIDGMIMVDLFARLRPDYKVMVNQILAHVRALSPNFIKVIPTGNEKTGPKAASLNGVRETLAHLRDGHPMGFFPSGAVSDLSLKDHAIRDRQWQEPVLRLIQKATVPVIPVRFFDRNSLFFYRLGLIDWRVRLLRLCRELANKRGKDVRIGIGETISTERQQACSSLEEYGQLLRGSVYDMPLPDNFVRRSTMDLTACKH